MNPALKLIPLTVAIALLISGCGRDGYYYDRNEEYRSAQLAEPLRLPETRQASRYQDAMPVPRANSDFLAEGEFDAPRPQPLSIRQQGEQRFVEAREAGGERWLLVNATPASVWPRLQTFVAQQGHEIVTLDASRGRIETAQATFSVRQGLRGNTSEIRCQEAAATATRCLGALEDYLAATGGQGKSVSLAAQTLSRDERVRLENRNGEWQLLLALGFERAWSELFYQLENTFVGDGRELLDQNRSRGEFLIEYTPRGADTGGFFGFFGGKEQARRYRLQVDEPSPGMTRVRVAAADDQPLSDSNARELLDTLAATLR